MWLLDFLLIHCNFKEFESEFFFFWGVVGAVLGFELGAFHLLGRYFTT
jgi:hypothetical protein